MAETKEDIGVITLDEDSIRAYATKKYGYDASGLWLKKCFSGQWGNDMTESEMHYATTGNGVRLFVILLLIVSSAIFLITFLS